MSQMMKAAVYHGDGIIKLEDRPIPTVIHPQDAVVRVILSTICTSDLHIKNGFVPRANKNIVLGHEFVGEVVSTGSQLTQLKPGDRVAANCITFCGECRYCKSGFINNCVKGGWELGCRIDGCQAEYVRVPFAHTGLTKIPDAVSYRSALFTGDILSSGYFGAELCQIQPGDTVAVLGAGPVGLCALQCAKLFGACKRIVIDVDQHRLDLAVKHGLCEYAVNAVSADPVKEVMAITQGQGADGVIEAAGGKDTFQTAWKIARPNSVVAIVAMYEQDQVLPLPSMYGKNLIFKTGGVDAVHCQRLLNLIEAGQINTDLLITHQAPLNEIMEGYRIFENKQDGCMKWVVTPYEH
ncbi:MAG: alcohol dehydrogenase [Massiliimalia sp.]|jgi:alcohol dehydrogenase